MSCIYRYTAAAFAVQMGFTKEDLHSDYSRYESCTIELIMISFLSFRLYTCSSAMLPCIGHCRVIDLLYSLTDSPTVLIVSGQYRFEACVPNPVYTLVGTMNVPRLASTSVHTTNYYWITMGVANRCSVSAGAAQMYACTSAVMDDWFT